MILRKFPHRYRKSYAQNWKLQAIRCIHCNAPIGFTEGNAIVLPFTISNGAQYYIS